MTGVNFMECLHENSKYLYKFTQWEIVNEHAKDTKQTHFKGGF